ncbi:hypothetical protein V5O48_010366, partial [Marasmius crinis-equi]
MNAWQTILNEKRRPSNKKPKKYPIREHQTEATGELNHAFPTQHLHLPWLSKLDEFESRTTRLDEEKKQLAEELENTRREHSQALLKLDFAQRRLKRPTQANLEQLREEESEANSENDRERLSKRFKAGAEEEAEEAEVDELLSSANE